MLIINIPATELFNANTNEFVEIKETNLQLEHSLMSVKKWEQKWHKPFINQNRLDFKTDEELLDYIRCMTINTVPKQVYSALTSKDIKAITDYIDNPMTATVFSNKNLLGTGNSGEYITNETIYYWMIELNIPVEFQKWHLNSLMSLIRFINVKHQPKKNMNAKEAAAYRKAENARRRAKLNSKG